MAGLSRDQHEAWERDGYLLLRGFEPEATCKAMLSRANAIAHEASQGADVSPALVVPEGARIGSRLESPGQISKIFRLARDEPVFRAFCTQPRLLDAIEELLSPDLDCFLSQFIFKLPGALGQPWHQDAFYFPFDRSPQIGAWLAVTEATLDNGPLWVLPGSHRERVHDVVPDRRPGANMAYVEIVDHDMSAAVPVLIQPGDLLLFHSHLMHRSTDNVANVLRAAMVYHYGETGTVDGTEERFGFPSPNMDWMSVRS